MQAAIEVSGLCKHYNGTRALDGVSATVPAGQIIGLLGHNGAGKTTFLKLVLGLIQPTAGNVRVLGSSVGPATRRQVHQRVGYLPESVTFYGNLTARETISYVAGLKGRPVVEGVALLDRVGLAGVADKRVHTFSKGMRQRLGLAQALLGGPELLLFDEPTAGLDPIAILQFLHLIGDLRAQGKTILISSHLLAELEAHLDRALVLSHGRVVTQGALTEMRDAADLPVIVRARVDSGAQDVFGDPVFVVQAVRTETDGSAEFELEVPRSRKLDLIRRLVGIPGLADISVKEPSLPEIYARLSGGRRPARGEGHA